MAEGAVWRFRMRRDAYGWQVGEGPRHLLRGTVLEGRVVRRNTRARRVVIDTGNHVLTLNEEDLEPAG
ncbi:MAG TPA: hypothetical protein VKA00_07185 [Trueperaceae bacterium]|nr:hypothetical protein [Trueperaceae bacterium]